MKTVHAELALDSKAILGEGPVWNHEEQCLYWVDIESNCFHRFDPETGDDATCAVGNKVGSLAPSRSGNLILGLRKGIARYNPVEKRIYDRVELETDLPENRFNDGKCDPSGRFWVGSMGPKGSAGLYRVDRSMKAVRVLDEITLSNGLAWDLEKKKFYYIDTPTRRIDVFDYDDSTGAITNRKPCFHIPEEDGVPDGMTIDADGMLWIAHWDGWGVFRYHPDTGEKLLKVQVPAAQTTSCAFGGDNLSTLFITSARCGLTGPQLEAQPFAGGLFKCKTETQGLPADFFAE